MSVLREKFYNRPRQSGSAKTFIQREPIIEPSEDAADMPILVDRMKRGQTPATRVAEYSSMLCNDTRTLLDNPPKKINDPTDVPFNELTKVTPVDESSDDPLNNE